MEYDIYPSYFCIYINIIHFIISFCAENKFDVLTVWQPICSNTYLLYFYLLKYKTCKYIILVNPNRLMVRYKSLFWLKSFDHIYYLFIFVYIYDFIWVTWSNHVLLNQIFTLYVAIRFFNVYVINRIYLFSSL